MNPDRGVNEASSQLALTDTVQNWMKNPDYRGHVDAAIHEYEALAGYYPGPEPACRLAMLLKSKGRTAEQGRFSGAF